MLTNQAIQKIKDYYSKYNVDVTEYLDYASKCTGSKYRHHLIMRSFNYNEDYNWSVLHCTHEEHIELHRLLKDCTVGTDLYTHTSRAYNFVRAYTKIKDGYPKLNKTTVNKILSELIKNKKLIVGDVYTRKQLCELIPNIDSKGHQLHWYRRYFADASPVKYLSNSLNKYPIRSAYKFIGFDERYVSDMDLNVLINAEINGYLSINDILDICEIPIILGLDSIETVIKRGFINHFKYTRLGYRYLGINYYNENADNDFITSNYNITYEQFDVNLRRYIVKNEIILCNNYSNLINVNDLLYDSYLPDNNNSYSGMELN